MKKKRWPRVGLIFILSVSLLLFIYFEAPAEEAKYIYDELGRLHQVIDEQGNAATYHYDAVGNLLSITRETGVTGPQITSISPNAAFGGDTVNVTITGTGLIGTSLSTNNPGITISDVKATATSITVIFTISFTANQGPTTVTVKNSLGTATTNFTVNPASPVINALQPSYGPVSRFVTVIGTGFRPNPVDNQVKFNGVPAQIYSSNPYRILTRVPAGATSGPVTVTTNGGTSNGVNFTVTSPAGPPPTITSITPNIGSEDGGSIITINGTGFISGTNVYIGGKAGQGVGIVSSTSLNVTTPSGSPGPADVLLTNDYGDILVPGGFTYVEGPTEQILAITPTMGLINIPINTRISALFTRPVDLTTVNTNSFALVETTTGTPVSGAFSFDFGDTFVGFTPTTNLKVNTSYTLNITRGIRSQEGIPLDRVFSGTFITTGSADTISPTVSVSPANGATEVPINSLIVMNFSEPVSTTTINSSTITVTENGTPKSGFLSIGNQNKTVTFTPAFNFSWDSSVSITLSQKITDTVGNRIVGSGGVGTDYISSFTATKTTDLLPPRVININPPDNATGINVGTTVSVTFSEPVNPLTVNSDSFTLSSGGNNLTGQIAFSVNGAVATFTPDLPLPGMSEITVTLAEGISDTADNAMPLPFTSTFTTGMAIDNFQPSVIKVSPYNGQTGVPLNSDVTLIFDERINPVSVSSSSFYTECYVSYIGWQDIAGAISVASDGLSATFTPSQPLLPSASCYIYYTNGIKDIAGNVLYNPGSSSFTTGASTPSDTTPPQVLEISPVDGTTGVPINTDVLIRFSEIIDPTTVNGSTVTVSAGGTPVGVNYLFSGTILRLEVANLYTFAPNTSYEVRVTAAVTDTAGNPLLAEFVSSFTTGSTTDTTAPNVVSIVPANGATGVSWDTAIEVTFTEAIDPMTVSSSTFGVSDSYVSSYGTYTVSSDRKKVTFTSSYPYVAGGYIYVTLQNIEDLAGNKLTWRQYYFRTAYSPGTDVNSFPTQATVVVNPNRLFADGVSTALVEITNISKSGVLVPNGTKIAVSASMGTILGGTDSPDPRYRIFTTIGGAVTLTYRSPNLSWLTPGSTTSGYIYVVSADAGNRPASYINTNVWVTLFRGKSVSIDVNPTSLLANGSSYSEVNVTVYDVDSKPVPSGMRIGVTAQPVYRPDSLGGTVPGGEAAVDPRFKIFQTITGGTISFNYTSPALGAGQSGKAWIQVAEVDDSGQVVGRIGDKEITLSASTGYTAPQPRLMSVSPANGQSGVGLNVPVVAEFSQSLDPSTVNSTNFSITKALVSVSGTLALSAGIYGPNTIVTFAPTNPWAPNSSYGVYIGTGIKGSSGSPLLQYSNTSFSTGTTLTDTLAPLVVKANPLDGTPSVAINAVISVWFSEPMSPSTLNPSTFKLMISGTETGGRVERLGLNYFRFIPNDLLLPNAGYQIVIDASAKDASGNPMTSSFTSTFTTQTGTDNQKPAVINLSPSSGTIDVPPTNPIVITFSESMDPITLSAENCYITDSSGMTVSSTVTLSAGNTQAILTPTYPLFAGRDYTIYVTTGVRDIAGNSLASQLSSNFRTALAPGTGTLPTAGSMIINPTTLFANGAIATTVLVSNIKVSGTIVPNGTLVGVTAAPAYSSGSVGGTISGPSVGTSVDPRFIVFATEGGSVTFFYTPPEIDWLTPGATSNGIIQVASVDSDTRPANLIVQGTATLYRVKTASITPNPATLSADGSSQSAVEVVVRDNVGNLVPDGTEIGVTVAPVFVANSAGGTILGGVQSGADYRVKTFTTAGGRVSFTFQAPNSPGPGYSIIQAVTVNNQGAPTGLINSVTINLN